MAVHPQPRLSPEQQQFETILQASHINPEAARLIAERTAVTIQDGVVTSRFQMRDPNESYLMEDVKVAVVFMRKHGSVDEIRNDEGVTVTTDKGTWDKAHDFAKVINHLYQPPQPSGEPSRLPIRVQPPGKGHQIT